MPSQTFFIDIKQLEAEGVSLEEAYIALEIKCFNKVFCRVSTLPKGFKEKAISIYEDCLSSGNDAFITENSFSLSIWQEKQIATEDYSPGKIKQQMVVREQEEIPEVNYLSGKKEEIILDNSSNLSSSYSQEVYSQKVLSDSTEFKEVSVTEDLSEVSDELAVELRLESPEEVSQENVDNKTDTDHNKVITGQKPRIYRGIRY